MPPPGATGVTAVLTALTLPRSPWPVRGQRLRLAALLRGAVSTRWSAQQGGPGPPWGDLGPEMLTTKHPVFRGSWQLRSRITSVALKQWLSAPEAAGRMQGTRLAHSRPCLTLHRPHPGPRADVGMALGLELQLRAPSRAGPAGSCLRPPAHSAPSPCTSSALPGNASSFQTRQEAPSEWRAPRCL